ncbi:hypothetical protein [Staphylococcus pseudoxylosus]|uniref:hypothetical protein n=1 Tax=Staphylococcus pseudoxylosus TaxID=2282419 RepID=UPI0039062A4C
MKNKLFELRTEYNLSIDEFCYLIEQTYSIRIHPHKVELWENNKEMIPNFYIHIFSSYFNIEPSEFER